MKTALVITTNPKKASKAGFCTMVATRFGIFCPAPGRKNGKQQPLFGTMRVVFKAWLACELSIYIYLPSSLQNAQNVLQIKDVLMQSLPQAEHHHPLCTPVKLGGLHQDRRSITPVGALPIGGCLPLHARNGPSGTERVF